MAYCSTADVQIAVGGSANLIALTDLANAGTVDTAIVAAAIAEADSAWIDLYVQRRYLTDPVPDAVRYLSARKAARILRRNGRMTTQADIEEEKTDLALLCDIGSGKATLPPATPASPIVVDKAGTRDTTKNVSRERLKGFW